MNEITNVFLFTGFLESGKTTFLQSVLENINFCNGQPTLLLVCEEGAQEYDSKRFATDSVKIEYIRSESELSRKNLSVLCRKAQASRVLVEYNGMWSLDTFYTEMPEDWRVFREMLFIDAATFMTYNTNMRQLMYDKLKRCTVACFNNPESLSGADKEMIHKIVRAASKRADIAYQYADGRTDYDTEVDALPYDIDAPTIVIQDYDYAVWTRDLTDNPANYDGKTVSVKLSTADCDGMVPNEICAGRYVMVCCENDMQFTGLVCENVPAELNKAGKWILVTGTLQIKDHPLYGARGPVMACVSARECDAPSQEVATFY